MDGAFFLWFAWMGIVITVFFIKASNKRNHIAFVLLLAICSVNLEFQIMDYTITGLFLLALIYGYHVLLTHMQVTRSYAVIIMLIVTAAYTSIELFSIYDPVFTYLYTKWSVSAVLFIIIHISLHSSAERCALLLLGVVHGEVILSTLFHQMGIIRVAGELGSFDILAISIMSTVVWHYFVQLTAHLEKLVKKHQERRGYS
ncbi:hypothetical protein [Pseudalkalibacillus hwajinpoensis]|uniref:Uncharacterized protein n=1 Tax=Guptibacillus hwajinpoensis TaxID=208199 RepID=A0A4U1MHB0_9BACL|nr:hypothetical protein [Pseudalkalibacillus hwajinpoensis]TKD69865.1 hypothetical protein FBF83_11370 [Pseudalkalibacillus hwajinpoensis]